MSGLDSDSDEDVFPGGRRDGEAARLLRQHAELVEKKRQEVCDDDHFYPFLSINLLSEI